MTEGSEKSTDMASRFPDSVLFVVRYIHNAFDGRCVVIRSDKRSI